jgi:hypothetical protein
MRLLKGSIAATRSPSRSSLAPRPRQAPTTPAAAAVFRITATAGLGTYNPLLPGCITPGPFYITSVLACAGGIANVLKANKLGPVSADVFTSCNITGTGVFFNPGTTRPLGLEPSGGTCGRSSETVSGTLSYNSATYGFSHVYDYSGTFQTAGSAVVITGSIGKRNSPPQPISLFTFVGDATPDPLAGTSCVTTRNQREFSVASIFGSMAVAL